MSAAGPWSCERTKSALHFAKAAARAVTQTDESATGPARAVRDRKQTTPRSHEGRDAAL